MNIDQIQTIQGRNLLLFDGLCGMCNRLVRFSIHRDASRRLLYAPLESSLGQEILTLALTSSEVQSGVPSNGKLDGVVLVESAMTQSQQVWVKSDAAVRVLMLLGGAWPIAGRILSWIPHGAREWAYGLVARWRYRVFGAYKTCPIPTLGERALILGTGSTLVD